MNKKALEKIQEGDVEGAIKIITKTSSREKQRIVRSTIELMANLEDSEWEAIDEWLDEREKHR